MKREPNGIIKTSWPHQPDVIDANHAVVTVLSGSSGTGGHASLFLEWISPLTETITFPGMLGAKRTVLGRPEMWIIDLTANQNTLGINWTILHYVENGQFKDRHFKQDAWYGARHTHSYDANRIQAATLWTACKRFMTKIGQNRYVYRQAGGVLGWIGSRPGQRGVNCSDFVIKVLRESGIAHINYKLYDTPIRISS